MAHKGTPRAPHAGRKKGTKNKSTEEAQTLATRLGVDPFEILLHMAAGNYEALGYKEERQITGYSKQGDAIEDFTIPVAVRAKAADRATEFLRPKLKAVEFTGDAANLAAYSVTQLIANAAALQAAHDKAQSGTAKPDKGDVVPAEKP